MSVHEGPVQVRYHDWGITVLCPAGHVVAGWVFAANPGGFGGSAFQARLSWHEAALRRGDARGAWRVSCDGALS